jgi:hypothetical protein
MNPKLWIQNSSTDKISFLISLVWFFCSLGSFNYQQIGQATGLPTGFFFKKRVNTSISALVANVLNDKPGMAHIAAD